MDYHIIIISFSSLHLLFVTTIVLRFIILFYLWKTCDRGEFRFILVLTLSVFEEISINQAKLAMTTPPNSHLLRAHRPSRLLFGLDHTLRVFRQYMYPTKLAKSATSLFFFSKMQPMRARMPSRPSFGSGVTSTDTTFCSFALMSIPIFMPP